MTSAPASPETASRSPMATAGVVCGIVGALGVIPFVPFVEYLFGPAAIVLGILGLRDASRGMTGKGMSVLAIVLGVFAPAASIAISQGLFAS